MITSSSSENDWQSRGPSALGMYHLMSDSETQKKFRTRSLQIHRRTVSAGLDPLVLTSSDTSLLKSDSHTCHRAHRYPFHFRHSGHLPFLHSREFLCLLFFIDNYSIRIPTRNEFTSLVGTVWRQPSIYPIGYGLRRKPQLLRFGTIEIEINMDCVLACPASFRSRI